MKSVRGDWDAGCSQRAQNNNQPGDDENATVQDCMTSTLRLGLIDEEEKVPPVDAGNPKGRLGIKRSMEIK